MFSALYWYYEWSGDEKIIDLIKRFYRGIHQSSSEYIAVHAVDFAHRFAYDGIYARLSGNPAHFARTGYLYDSFAQIWGQMPRGIFAADEQVRAGCTDPRQGCEPCGMVELAKNFYDLGRISSQTIYGDRAEDMMLNHFPASFTEDYRQIHYITSANRPILSNGFFHQTHNGTVSHDRSTLPL